MTLVVNRGQITAVDRDKQGITFGEITIPPVKQANTSERDRVEQEFLQWRAREMAVRYERTIARQEKK